jgi:predicted MFS family arabinose efflux permease
MSVKVYIDVLKNVDFTKLWISQVTSQLTNYLLSFAILVQVFEQTQSSFKVGMIIFIFGLATVFFGSMAGVYADRFDRQKILTIINYLQAAAVASYLFFHSFWAIVIITFIYSALNQFYLPSEAPSIPNLVDKKHLLAANSYFATTASMSLIIGFAAAGPMIVLWGINSIFLTGATLLIIAGSATAMLPSLQPEENREVGEFGNIWKDFKKGLDYFLDSKKLHYPFYSLIAIQLINGIMITIVPAFVEKIIGVKLERNSILIVAPLGVGILTGTLILAYTSKRFLKEQLVRIGFIGMSAAIIFLSFTPYMNSKMYYYLIVSFVMGIFNAHIFPPSHSLLQGESGDSQRGRVYGSLYVVLHVAATAPALLVGYLADKIYMPIIVAIAGVALLAIGQILFSFVLISKKDRNNLTDFI